MLELCGRDSVVNGADGKTLGELYGPAMEITNPEVALAHFTMLVRRCMKLWGISLEAAQKAERGNLAYYAGCHSYDVGKRVRRLFDDLEVGRE